MFYLLPPPHSNQMSSQTPPTDLVNSRLYIFTVSTREENKSSTHDGLKNLREELQQAQEGECTTVVTDNYCEPNSTPASPQTCLPLEISGK